MKNKSILILFLLLITYTVSFAQEPGDLDGDFDADGKVLTQLGDNNDIAFSLVIQTDGKIIVAGQTSSGSGAIANDFGVVRYSIDGSLDNSFGINGMVTSDFSGDDDRANSVVMQPDGKIIVAGMASDSDGTDFALLRYNADGIPDNTFGSDGKVITDLGSTIDRAFSVALQSDGKIVVAGRSSNGMVRVFALVRYNTDGTLDNTFDTDGIVTTIFTGGSADAFSIKLQLDGKIVVAGVAQDPIEGHNFAVARYNSDGSLDNNFSIDGRVTTAFGSGSDLGEALLIQPDGKIIVTGSHDLGAFDEFAIVRYNIDGTLDNSFGSNGKVTTPIGDGGSTSGRAVVLQADGKIVVSGTGANAFAVVRYNSDGTLDNSFDSDGILTTDFGGGFASAHGCAIQSNGKIVVAGTASVEERFVFALARYISGSNLGVIQFLSRDHSLLIYPNPIQESTLIEYTLINDETISIDLYNISGSLVQSIIKSEKREKGPHKEMLDFHPSIPSGSYILTISNGEGSSSLQVVK